MTIPPPLQRYRLRLITVAAVITAIATSPAWAAPDFEGRWEGEASVPGAPLAIVIDLAKTAAQAWAGSVTLPGRGVKGAALREIGVDDLGLRFGLDAAIAGSAEMPTTMVLRAQPDGSLAGEFRQGGHVAAALLRRSGPAQVDLAPRSSTLNSALLGTWLGRYELGGYARDVTLTLDNQADGRGAGEMTIVGKRTTRLPIDLVLQGSQFLRLESGAAGVRVEGRWFADDGRIDALFVQGPFEAPLLLRRAGGPGRAP